MSHSRFVLVFILCTCAMLVASQRANTLKAIFEAKQRNNGQAYAGVASVDATLPVGVPLAGYNYPPRRAKGWPAPKPTKYTTFMTPSEGVDMPLWSKCLTLQAGNEQVAFISIDAIGADGNLFNEAYNIAASQGFNIPKDNIILSGSHSHSGPGALTQELLWELAPATDLLVPEVRTMLSRSIAACLVEAQYKMKPVSIGVGVGQVANATHNRRARISPYVTPTTVDTQLGVIRVDDTNGQPLATVWNFAIHGTCLDADQLKMHGDIMGVANQFIEKQIGGFSFFVNSDAGDIAPSGCKQWQGSQTLADAVQITRSKIVTTNMIDELAVASSIVDFGKTHLNLTLERLSNCTHGGPIDICTFCSAKILNCHWDVHLGSNWLENQPRFTAVRLSIKGVHTLLVTVPGEAIFELGTQIKQDSYALGFNNTFVYGYSNNHMGYFTTAREYIVGGYESQLTFWGIGTSEKVRAGCATVAKAVKP